MADLRALVALAADDERDLAGAVEHPHALVERASERHQPVHLEQVVARQAQVRAEASAASVLLVSLRGRLVAI